MNKKQKLELTWIGKENRPKLEPRILLEDPKKSYHAKFRVKGEGITRRRGEAEERQGNESSSLRASASPRENLSGDIFDNRLIHGDNLLALKALEQEFAGQVKCVFIDPNIIWQKRTSRENRAAIGSSHDQLQQLSEEVGTERSLLVVCSSFRGRKEGYPNLTVKKIPKAVLTRCEWRKDDYSLNVENLPKAPPPMAQQELL